MNKISDIRCLNCDMLFFKLLTWLNSQLHNRVLMDETAWILMLQTWLITTKAKSTFTIFVDYLCHQQLSFSLFIKEQSLSFPLGLCWWGPVVWLFSRQGWDVQLGAVSLSWRTKESYCVPTCTHSGVIFLLNHVKPIELKKIISPILNEQHQNPSKSLITVAYKK